jgi:hypothetical protein
VGWGSDNGVYIPHMMCSRNFVLYGMECALLVLLVASVLFWRKCRISKFWSLMALCSLAFLVICLKKLRIYYEAVVVLYVFIVFFVCNLAFRCFVVDWLVVFFFV